jgi:hypothetical protein
MMLLNRDSVIFRFFLFRVILLEDSVQIPSKSNRIPCIHPDDVIFRPDAHLSSIIRSDDENFPSRPSFESRSFELFSVASVRTSQQQVRMPFSVWQGKKFCSKTQIWEDSCNRSDDVCSCPDAILDKAIACSWSVTVRTLGQHCPDAALFRKEFQVN